MTDEMRTLFYDYLLGEKQNAVAEAQLQRWVEEGTVVRNEEVIASLMAGETAEAE